MPRQRQAAAPDPDPRLAGLTERTVEHLVDPRIHARGVRYARDGAVVEIAWRGEVLHAAVQGSEDEPYQVAVEARGDRLAVECECPYFEDQGGAWCKHIVATLLVALAARGAIPSQPTVAELLAPLDRDALAWLVEHLVELDPGLYDSLAPMAADAASGASAVPHDRR
jgi:uncharacterized Zn finger protein